MRRLQVAETKGWYEDTWVEYRNATQDEIMEAALSQLKNFPITSAAAIGGKIRPWCVSHDAPYEDFGAIDKGCGWGNPLKRCEQGNAQVVIPL